MKSTLITYLTVLTAVFALGTAQAAPKKGEAKADATKTEAAKAGDSKKDKYPLYGVVVSVSPKLLTIKGGEGKEDRKFTINADTKIKDGEKDAKLDDIKVGKWVGGYIQKVDGTDTALSINVGAKQKAAKEDGAAPKKPAEDAKKSDTKGKKKAA